MSALYVLVTEDEPAIASAVAAALRRAGHEVAVARGVRDALGLPRPDVLVADVRLGEGSGLDLLAELRAEGWRGGAVLTSGLPEFADCRRALQLGASDLLPKPFRLEELVVAVRAARPRDARPACGGEPRFQRDVDADIEDAERCVLELLAFLLRQGVSPSTRARVASACAEILDNAVRHAWPEAGGEERIQVEASIEDGTLSVAVGDGGRGFDATRAALECGGSEGGLARAAALAEDIRLESAPGQGTRVEICFAVWSAEFDDGEGIDLSELDYLPVGLSRRVLDSLRGSDAELPLHLSPALAVTVGRLLAGTAAHQRAQLALWS